MPLFFLLDLQNGVRQEGMRMGMWVQDGGPGGDRRRRAVCLLLQSLVREMHGRCQAVVIIARVEMTGAICAIDASLAAASVNRLIIGRVIIHILLVLVRHLLLVQMLVMVVQVVMGRRMVQRRQMMGEERGRR